MINIIIEYLPYLALMIFLNLITGLYYNLEKIKEDFSWKKLLSGLIKAIFINIGFIGLALTFEKLNIKLDIANYELRPDILLISAISTYFYKVANNLKNILKIENLEKLKEPIEEIEIIRG